MDYWFWTLLITLITLIIFQVRKYKQFDKYGVPHPREIPFLGCLGMGLIRRVHITKMVQKLYDLNDKAKYVGCHMFITPMIMLRDLDVIKSVLVKDFDHFAHHKIFVDEANDPLFGKNLVFLNGERWREVRNLLSPAFTSSKMRAMYVLMENCAANFAEQLLKLHANEEATDMKDVFTRYANDVIATCAFGLEVDSLKNPTNQFYMTGRRSTAFNRGIIMIKFMFMRFFPELTRKFGMRVITKEDSDFFIDVIKSTIEAREERGITRPDMLQLMIDARNSTTNKINLDLLEMTAQAFVFFLGGFETTSTQACLIAHELAVNPDIQRQLQEEIDAVMKESNGKPSYETVNNMPYLDAVFSETLRMHPMPFLSRMCSKTFDLPPALPGSKPYTVTPGTEILVPACAIHSDPNYYENPKKFDPERFLNNKKATHSDVTALGFGLGPRMCIGNRFAILETKVLFLHLMHKCNLVPCKRTCIPLEYDITNFSPAAKGGFWLRIEPRS